MDYSNITLWISSREDLRSDKPILMSLVHSREAGCFKIAINRNFKCLCT